MGGHALNGASGLRGAAASFVETGAAARAADVGPMARIDHDPRIPLAVDLDGTLIRGDLLRESLIGLVARALPTLPEALGALWSAFRAGGKAGLKAILAERVRPDPATLPYREEILALVRDARAAGRRVILVTAADRRHAEAVAAHLGLFHEAHGSDGRRNFSGEVKAAFLVARFGDGGFDYVGDAPRDLAVWAAARQAVTVAAPPALARAAEALAAERAAAGRPAVPPVHLAPPARGPARLVPWVGALRPHQWVKNLLVLAPILSEHRTDAEGWTAALLTAAAFCLVASAAYVVNDLFDIEADRAHPRKRTRPFASGRLSATAGAAAAPVLLALALATAAAVSSVALGVTALYFGATLLYTLVLKRELVIDICTLAGLYALRLVAGTWVIGSQLSPWMLAFTAFVFLSLAAMKRQTELVSLARRGAGGRRDGARPVGLGRAAQRHAAGRAYRAEDLPVVTMMAIAAGYTAVLVLSLYIYSPSVQALYKSPLILWGIPPIVIYWLSRMVMIAHRGGMDDDPVLFALRDRISLACVGGVGAVLLAAGSL